MNISRAPTYSVSRRYFRFAKAEIFFSFSLVFLSTRSFPRYTFSFILLSFSLSLTSGRRIGKDDASTSTTTWPAALRRLNINPSAEVAGFQLRRHDARRKRKSSRWSRDKCKEYSVRLRQMRAAFPDSGRYHLASWRYLATNLTGECKSRLERILIESRIYIQWSAMY